MPYPARSIALDPRDYASHQSLVRLSAFVKGAGAVARQTAIDYVVTAHAFSKDHTRSLAYVANLDLPGRNVRGDIRIGPQAFEQDMAWLAGIVFHELVHSPQYAYYASKGVPQINPTRSETERLMIALDEYEAYWWSLKRAAELGLSHSQQSEIRRRAQHALIDLDDPTTGNLARKQQFDVARDDLIRRYNTKSANTQVPKPRRACAGCSA
jgi:hypothetical protein